MNSQPFPDSFTNEYVKEHSFPKQVYKEKLNNIKDS